MSDDIVERLTDQATLLDYATFMQDSVDKRRLIKTREMLNNAAAEITRLRSLSTGRDSVVEECAKVADRKAEMLRNYGSQRDRGSITCDRLLEQAATCSDLAKAIRALKRSTEKG